MSKQIEEVLDNINKKKSNLKQRVKIELKEENLSNCWDVFNKIANTHQPKFDNSELTDTITQMIKWVYFHGDLNPQNGILLNGKSGRGKTLLLKSLMSFMEIDGIKFQTTNDQFDEEPLTVDAQELQIEFDEYGMKSVGRFFNAKVLRLEDIGKEVDIIQYGRKSIVSVLIDYRESRNHLTLATTNVGKLSKIYDDRTISRMKAHFNIISINHEIDYREKNK